MWLNLVVNLFVMLINLNGFWVLFVLDKFIMFDEENNVKYI